MKRIIKLFIPCSIRDYFTKINSRISNLECAVDVLIESPTYSSSDDIGFNGQMIRKQIFKDLLSIIKFDVIVETGTFIGNTTGYMAEISQLPVYTSELNGRLYSLSKMRLSDFKSINFELLDSRLFLKKIANSELSNKCVFFYLDAHWNEDLPLQEEIILIATFWRDFVIMVDDFKVPNDAGYGFDNYGKSKVLSIEYFKDILNKNNLIPFFPSKPSTEETGAKRGCVVIVKNGDFSDQCSRIKSLHKAEGF